MSPVQILRFRDLSPHLQTRLREHLENHPIAERVTLRQPNGETLVFERKQIEKRQGRRPGTQGPRANNRQMEEGEQRQVIKWADSLAIRQRHPELAWLFHPSNGGKRDKITAFLMKLMGVRRGVPDLWLPVRRGPYVGCVIELKPTNKPGERTRIPTPDQERWIAHLQREGWQVTVCYGSAEACEILRQYLKLGSPPAFQSPPETP